MTPASEWYTDISNQICALKLSPRNYRRYRVAELLRLAAKVDALAASCPECRRLKSAITGLARDLGRLPLSPGQEEAYYNALNTSFFHLKEIHGMTSTGNNTILWLGLGLVVGAGVGYLLESLMAGIAIGAIAGIIIGGILDFIASRRQRVI